MDNLMITLEQLPATAADIRMQNQQLNNCLQEIYAVMKQLSAYWQSPSSETIRNRFQAMLPVFDSYKAIVESYARFLEQTASSYQQLENQLNSNADAFR